MGLFSLFRRAPPEIVDEDEAYARLAANSEALRQPDLGELERQRDLARATVLKIDAIEAAMAADIFNDTPAFRRPPRPPPVPVAETAPDIAVTELLDDDELPAEAAAAERAPLVEEAAILHANGDTEAAGELLAGGLGGQPGGDRTAWWMLFDLYQLTNRQAAFDSLSIDYASTFETSPPPWHAALADAAPAFSGVTPTAVFAGVLDGAAAAQVARLRAMAGEAPMLRLDFSRVTGVEPEGCALLHAALRDVQHGRELMLAGADDLLALLRAMLDVGRRDEGEAPWLLLLELLRLLNREKDFDETAMDYCVTFEVSPPPFTPPGRVASAPRQAAAPTADRFLLPRTIAGDTAATFDAMRAYAVEREALVFDCTRLARIDFAAAGQLPGLLRELAAGGRRVELRAVNHLVAALLRLQGVHGVARLFPHRY